MIVEAILKLAKFEKDDSRFHPRPSLAGKNRCTRSLVYFGLDFPKDPMNPRMHFVFDDGNWHEELTLDWLRKSSLKVHSEQMEIVCPAPMSKGRIDALVTPKSLPEMLKNDYLLELKSVTRYFFDSLWNGELPEDYFTQMAIYFHGLQSVNPDITEGWLVFKCKDTSQYAAFKVRYDKPTDTLFILELKSTDGMNKTYTDVTYPNIIKDTCDKFNFVQECVAKKHLPKRDYDFSDWHCDYCRYKTHCWKEFVKEFNQLTTDAQLSEEIETAAGYYKECQGHESSAKKEKETAKKALLEKMTECKAREGKTGRYLIRWRMLEVSKLNLDMVRETLNEDQVTQCTEVKSQERLDIRLLEQKAVKEPKAKPKLSKKKTKTVRKGGA